MTIHLLSHGVTACMKPGVPADWEPGHVWSANWKDVTCPECLKRRDRAPNYEKKTHQAQSAAGPKVRKGQNRPARRSQRSLQNRS